MQSFTNFKNGTAILQVCTSRGVRRNHKPLITSPTHPPTHISYPYMPTHAHTPTQGALAQLIQFYHRFQKVLSQPPFKPLPIRGELINIHHLMVEVKKHRTSF